MQLSPYDENLKKEYQAIFHKIFKNLKDGGKLNPDRKAVIEKTHEMIRYFDFCRIAVEVCQHIGNANNGRLYEEFKKDVKKYGIGEREFKGIYSSVLMYNFLVMFSNVENMLLDMIKGVDYERNGKTETVTDRATLGTIVAAIKYQCPDCNLPEDVVDVKFRNALAHTWYKIEDEKLLYYENSSLTEPIEMDMAQLHLRFNKLNVLGNALGELVLAADWD